MSRRNRFLKGVSSGYLTMAANILYTMGSIPLALHYLPKAEFGLWALITQLASYFSLIDLGMYTSTARHIIDCKDDKANSRYGSMVLTAAAVFTVQGIIVAAGGALLCSFASTLVALPSQYVAEFQILLAFQCLFLGLGFLTRLFGILLYAHQRYDVVNLTQASQLGIMFVTLWTGFYFGLGLYSMLVAGFSAFLWSTCVELVACIRLRLLPRKDHWGRPNRKVFGELFVFGRDIFLVGLGAQLINATQVVIITRVLGLEAAATWAICTKVFILAQQFLVKTYDYAQGAFSEMFVRGELGRLRHRFRDISTLIASLSVFVCASIAISNAPFIYLWTNGKVSWSIVNDILMAGYVFCTAVFCCHGCLAVYTTKEVGFARWIYFLEGATFVVLGYIMAKFIGLPGVFLSLIIAKICFSGLYGYYRSKHFFHCSYRELVFDWLSAPLRYLGIYSIAISCIWAATLQVDIQYRLFVIVPLLLSIGLPLLWFFGITPNLREEIRRMAGKLVPLLSP